MIRSIATLTLAAAILSVTGGVAAARSATVRHDSISITTPTKATSYNRAPVVINPRVKVRPGSHRQVISKHVHAYQAGRSVQSGGTTVRLRPGVYGVATSIKYRTYRYVTKTRLVRTWHGGWDPDGSKCVVTAVYDWDDDGIGDDIKTATCTNAGYPGQVVHAQNPLDNDSKPSYSVGDRFVSDFVWFNGQYVNKRVYYQAKHWTGYHFFTSPRSTVTVRDGGYRRVYTASESADTGYFAVPSHWSATYSYDCSSFGLSGNWILSLHRLGSSVLDDTSLNNDIRYAGSGTYTFAGAGSFRFEVITECDWTIVVHWR